MSNNSKATTAFENSWRNIRASHRFFCEAKESGYAPRIETAEAALLMALEHYYELMRKEATPVVTRGVVGRIESPSKGYVPVAPTKSEPPFNAFDNKSNLEDFYNRAIAGFYGVGKR